MDVFELTQAEQGSDVGSAPEVTALDKGEAPAPKSAPAKATPVAKATTPGPSAEQDEDITAEEASDEEVVSEEEALEEESTEEEVAEPEVELIELSDGLKIPENAVAKRKIDGELRDVKIKDALDQYSIKFAGDKRFAEANKIKQKAEHKENSLKKISSRFVNAVSKGHTRDAIDILCEFTGGNANDIWPTVVAAQKDAIRKLSEMSNYEWEMYEKGQDADYWQRKNEYTIASQHEQSIETQKEAVKEKHGFTDEDLRRNAQILLDLKQKGAYNKEITLDDVVSIALDERIYQSIDQTIKETLPEKVNDFKLYDEIFKDTKEHQLTKEDWISLLNDIKQAGAKPSAKPVSSKLAQKADRNTSPTGAKKKITTAKPKSSVFDSEDTDLLDIVDLDELN